MKIDISLYQHFSFDLWLTLIRSNPLYKRKRDELLKDFFSVSLSLEQVQAVVRYYDVLSNKIGETTGVHFDRNAIYLLILNQLGVDMANVRNDKVLEFCQISEELFFEYKPVLVYPEIHHTMKEINIHGKTMSIMSNTGFIYGKTLRQILDHYELTPFFSFQLYSDETGYSKPNKEMFELTYKKISAFKTITRRDIVHIGDSETADLAGARNIGFQSVLINN
ncbi:HAD family hydrolase [Parapedobacter sp. 2B3]|uniref:HAD family hydrolase n=1 Tax=Parapedobacter sp. 2B3 TaxID=3342381 RepID=UPI0035B60E85